MTRARPARRLPVRGLTAATSVLGGPERRDGPAAELLAAPSAGGVSITTRQGRWESR